MAGQRSGKAEGLGTAEALGTGESAGCCGALRRRDERYIVRSFGQDIIVSPGDGHVGLDRAPGGPRANT